MDKEHLHIILQLPEDKLLDEYITILLKRVRADISNFILTRGSGYENFFDLSPYHRLTKNLKTGEHIMKTIIDTICGEINETGFLTKLGYGNTAIFIYKGEVPRNCW